MIVYERFRLSGTGFTTSSAPSPLSDKTFDPISLLVSVYFQLKASLIGLVLISMILRNFYKNIPRWDLEINYVFF